MSFNKTKILISLFIFCTFLNPMINAESLDKTYNLSEELSIKKATNDVFIITHSFPWPANSMIVKCSGGNFIWVDTPYNNEATKQVFDWLQSNFGKIRITQINTGFHNDNLGGNGFLKQRGIDIYGSHLTVRLLNERVEQTRSQILKWLEKPKNKRFYKAHKTAVYIKPTKLFDLGNGPKLIIGGEKVEVYYPGPSHSIDNVVVYFPNKKLLFGGCMVKSIKSKNLGFIGDSNIEQWPISLKKLLTRYRDAQIVVPGHGTSGSIDLISHTLTLF